MQANNQDTVEILVTSRMDMRQLEASMRSFEQKIKEAEHTIKTSSEKLTYIETKNANKRAAAYTEATQKSYDSHKAAKKMAEASIEAYKNQNIQIEKQIKLLNSVNNSLSKSRPDLSGTTASTGTKATTGPIATPVSGNTSTIDRVIKQHDTLNKTMLETDRVAKNTFPHKVFTTSQYMLAGAGIMAVTGSIASMVSAFLEADKAFHMFRGVLELTDTKARELQSSVFNIGATFGGSIEELNNAALSLGRAGIESKSLGEALKSVSQLALISGESMDTITGVLVSWQSLYPDKTIGQLGDVIVKLSNDTKASVADFATMSTYILTAGQQAGVTVESLGALAAGMRQIGKGSSTSGTELRRFFNQLSTGSDEVRQAFTNLGIDMDGLSKALAKGGIESDKAMSEFFKLLKGADTQSLEKISAVLDKSTLKSLMAISKASKDGKPLFDALLESAYKAQGASAKAAEEVALSFTIAMERMKNVAFKQAAVIGDAFTKKLFDSTSTGAFDAKIKELTSDTGALTQSMQGLGTALGFIVKYIDDAAIAWVAYRAVMLTSVGVTAIATAVTGLSGAFNLLNGSIVLATVSQRVFNAVAAINPWIAIATGIAGGVAWLYEYNKELDKVIKKSNIARGNKYLAGVKEEITGMTRGDQAQRIQERSAELYLSEEIYNKEIKTLEAKDSLNSKDKLNLELLKRKVAIIKETQPLLQKQLNAVNNAATTEKKQAELAKTTVTGIAGVTAPTDKLPTKASIESANKNLLDEELQRIRLKEQQYFYDHKITSELEQQKYHVNTTLKDELKATEDAGFYKNQLEDTLKVKVDIWKTSRAIQEAEYQSAMGYSRKIEDLQVERTTIGIISDKQKVQLDAKARELTIDRTREDLKHAGLYTAEQIYQISVQMLENSQALTDEQERQLVIASRLRDESIAMTSLQIQAANATSGKDQIAIEQQMIRTKFANEQKAIADKYLTIKDETGTQQAAEIENARLLMELELRKVEGAETYYDLLVKSNIAFERQNSTAQKFSRITEAGLAGMSAGLTSYFSIGDEGFGKWSKLRDTMAKAVMDALIQELIISQIIMAVRTGMQAMSFGFMAKGGVIDSGGNAYQAKGGVNYLANGGYVNSIVSKPTYVAKGTIAGEAGAEAVMPLQRDSKGRLGVNTTGGSGEVKNVTVNIVNESGEKLAVTKSEAQTDMSGLVLDIVIDAIARNRRGMRDIVKG